MYRLLLLSAVALSTPALAAEQPPSSITVTGTGSVRTPPDVATVAYGLHGEGATSDEALKELVAKRSAIDGGLAAIAGVTPARGGEVRVREVRGRECNRNDYGAPQLSTGPCAIVGYTADLAVSFRTNAVRDAGTMAGLIGRLGGTDPRVEGFAVADETPGRRRAFAAALTDARQKAEAIAAGAGVRLGNVVAASDGSGYQPSEDVIVTGSRIAPPPPPAAPVAPPVAVSVTPQPIETQARVIVVYQITP